MLAIVQLDLNYLAVAVDKGLLVNTANTLNIANVVGILAAQVTWVLGFNLAVRLLFFPRLL